MPETKERDPNLMEACIASQNSPLEAFTDLCIIVIGNNQCWGKGATLNEARKNASSPTKYIAWLCHKDTTVSGIDAALSWTTGFAPRLVEIRGVKAANLPELRALNAKAMGKK